MPERSLEGLRVVEFTDEAGSYCGRLLADLGADVIKVEPPGGGRQRHSPPYYAATGEGVDSSLAFWIQNTSKQSVVLDLDAQAGRQAAQGVLLAVLHADATGEGQLVDVSAQEAVQLSQETAMQTWDLQHRNRVRTGEKGSLPVKLPALGNYACKDGYVMCFVVAPAGADFS